MAWIWIIHVHSQKESSKQEKVERPAKQYAFNWWFICQNLNEFIWIISYQLFYKFFVKYINMWKSIIIWMSTHYLEAKCIVSRKEKLDFLSNSLRLSLDWHVRGQGMCYSFTVFASKGWDRKLHKLLTSFMDIPLPNEILLFRLGLRQGRVRHA